jgi:hypothetical protein
MKVIESKKFILLVVLFASTVTAYKVIYAVNLGGNAATDSNEINFQKDYITEGYTSSCPENMTISGKSKEDEIIYEGVRFVVSESVEIAAIPDILDNGEYLINFKIIECWAHENSVRPINITINKHHTITVKVNGTDDQGLTLDKYYYFNICDKKLHFEDTSSPYTDGPLIIDLGPEVNGMSAAMSAIVLIKLIGNPIPKSLWPTKDDDLAKIPNTFICRTINEDYNEMHQQHKELSSHISNLSNIAVQVKTQIGIVMANQNKLEAQIAGSVKQQEYQSELLSKISKNDRNLSATYFQQGIEIQQIQKNQEEISSKLVTIFDILNGIQFKINKPQKKTFDIIDDSEL